MKKRLNQKIISLDTIFLIWNVSSLILHHILKGFCVGFNWFLKEAEAKIESLSAEVEEAKSKSEEAVLEATETSEQEQVNFDWRPRFPPAHYSKRFNNLQH